MTIHLFGDFELDTSLYELRRSGAAMEIGPRVFDVLAYLVRYRDRLVSKDELIRQVWGVTAMSSSSVPTCIAAVRKVLGDDPANPQYIETHRGRGYRFIAPVTRAVPEGDAGSAATLPDGGALHCDMHRAGFVGRENELAALYAGFEQTLAGTPQLVLIAGEPGIGKTRTIEEFALSARDDGAVVLIGRCAESEGAPAFWPWVQIVRSHVEASESTNALNSLGSLASSLLLMIPELSELHPDLPRPPQLDADQARFRLFEAVTALLANAAAERPLVVLVDDLHRADTASLLLLQFATRELRDAQILFIGTYRDAELHADSGRVRTLSDLAREEPARCIQLHGLPIESVELFIAQSSATGIANSSLVTALYDQTGGNPFFLTQIVHLLTAEGDLGRFEPHALQKIDLPGGVREAISRQLDGLPQDTRRVLEVAAVAGRDFETSALATATGMEINAVLAALEPAHARQLIASTPGQIGRSRFAHMLLRDCVYEGLGVAERVHLHLRIGEALEDLHSGRLDARITELAHHFHEAIPADGPDRAIHYSIEAARWADARLAYEDVPSHYRCALRLLDQKTSSDPLEYGNLLLTLGQAEIRAGERDRAQETFKEAVQIARENNAPDLLAHAALGLAPGFFAIEVGVFDPLLVSLLEEALRTLEQEPSPLRAQLIARLSTALVWATGDARRQTLSSAALTMAMTIGETESIARALSARHESLWGPRDFPERLETINRLGELAYSLSDPEFGLTYHLLRITAHLEGGDANAADEEIANYSKIAHETRQPQYMWYTDLFAGMRALMKGDFERARTVAESFLETGTKVKDSNAYQSYGTHQAILAWEEGRSREMIAPVEDFIARYPSVNAWRCVRMFLHTDLNMHDEAMCDYEYFARSDFNSIQCNPNRLVSLCLLAEVCSSLNDTPRARTLYQQLTQERDHFAVIGFSTAFFGSVAERLGILATRLGNHKVARRHFQDSIASHIQLGAKPWIARTQFRYAKTLAEQRSKNDLKTAVHLLHASYAASNRLGMSNLNKRVSDLLNETSEREALLDSD